MEKRFAEKNMLVVGASSGIGWRLTRVLREEGAQVSAWNRTPREEFRSLGVTFSPLDVTQPLGEDATQPPGVLHGLVYCPGNIRLDSFQRLKDEEFLEDFNLNVLGAIRVIRHCLPSLFKAKGASVVLISTVAASRGMNFHTPVATAKSALEGLSRSLAAEYARRQIRVNTVAPSITETPLSEKFLGTEEKREASAKRHPLGRIGQSQDIAAAITFLLSEESGWITGQVLPVDGGLSAIR